MRSSRLANVGGSIPIGARGNSYFRIGWEWVKSAKAFGWKLIHQVRFTSNYDPDPAMASRKQHQKRYYRLEFKVKTYDYAFH
ncbi:hypothetical protein [Moorena sp. SIO3A2]|uniref:hypothetical protein n=1 Tax=Moorena sp. SIO3A2 TaxID=2607841 RepID=UPI002580CED4|nr:hypothetical protein [Moorena sp. SIO3A2]